MFYSFNSLLVYWQMDSGKNNSMLGKRVSRDSVDERSPRRFSPLAIKKVNNSTVEKVFEFCVLLPNGTSVDLKIRGKSGKMTLQEFVILVKNQYLSRIRTFAPEKQKKTIDWNSQSLHIVDAYENKITMKLNLEDFKADKCHILRLKVSNSFVLLILNVEISFCLLCSVILKQDGSDEVDFFEVHFFGWPFCINFSFNFFF